MDPQLLNVAVISKLTNAKNKLYLTLFTIIFYLLVYDRVSDVHKCLSD